MKIALIAAPDSWLSISIPSCISFFRPCGALAWKRSRRSFTTPCRKCSELWHIQREEPFQTLTQCCTLCFLERVKIPVKYLHRNQWLLIGNDDDDAPDFRQPHLSSACSPLDSWAALTSSKQTVISSKLRKQIVFYKPQNNKVLVHFLGLNAMSFQRSSVLEALAKPMQRPLDCLDAIMLCRLLALV